MSDDNEIVSLEAFRLAKKPPEAAQPDNKDAMIALLREAIAEAESGKLRGFFLARNYVDESMVQVRGQLSRPSLLWLLERTKKAILP
jgi:hypothetical protein